MYEMIYTEQRGDVCVITLNRPERLNAWTPQMGAELSSAITTANADDSVLAMVVTGAGRGFCAGADIEAVFKKQADQPAAAASEASDSGVGNWVTLLRGSKPLVAAVNGAAVGVGLTQILPMDYLMAAEGAKLSVRFVKMGLVPELASSRLLFARLGVGHASELMLTGKTIDAAGALAIGLVDRVVAADELLDEACRVARDMGNNPQAALLHIKALITQNSTESDLDQVQRRELRALQECYQSAEHKEAIAAFLEKREPDFSRARGS